MSRTIRIPKKNRRAKLNRDTGYEDPSFDGWETWSGEKFHKYATYYKSLYRTSFDKKTLVASVFAWMKQEGYSKEDIASAKAAPYISIQPGILCKLMAEGLPDYNQAEKDYWCSFPATGNKLEPNTVFIKKCINKAIAQGQPLVEQKKLDAKLAAEKADKYPKPTIQEVMFNTACNMSERIDEIVENYIDTGDYTEAKKFNFVRELKKKFAKANHARIIKGFYIDEYEELLTLINMPKGAELKQLSEEEQDNLKQLAEGYSHKSSKEIKTTFKLFKSIVDACDIIIAEQKTLRKPRKVKQKTASQLVSKLKYKSSDSEYGIASVGPDKLVGAVAAIVFNCKNRKMGIYVAEDSDGFVIKGTTLHRFNEDMSFQKTIRKPDQTLSIFKSGTKVKCIREFNLIKASEKKLNGRFNSETIILAVFK